MSKAEKRKITADEWKTYGRLIAYVKPYQKRLIIGFIFGVLFGTSTAGALAGLGQVLKMVFQSDVPLSWTAKITIASILPVFTILRGVGDYLCSYLISWIGNRVIMDLRTTSFAHLQDLALGFYQRNKTGELISRVVNDTTMVERAVSNSLVDLAKQPFAMISVIALMFWNNWQLAVVGLLLFPICIVPVSLFGRRVRRYAREAQQKVADLVSILQETATGVRIVKAFGMEKYEIDRFNERCRSVFNRIMRVTRANAAVEPIIVSISSIGASLFLLYNMRSAVTFNEFAVFLASLIALYEPVKKLSKIHLNIQQSSASADRIFELLDEPVTVRETSGAKSSTGPIQDVAFEHVSFAYEDKPVLNDICFKVPAGKHVALVGGSGAGKSTMVSLIPRFYDVTGGKVTINGRDIRAFTLKALRAQIGIVTQEVILFNDTVANNIAYGHSEASREAVIAAAKKAHAHEFIMEMPDGYDTVVGERGMRLSGGQCQRLAIARAILRNPPILILDEATSALDTESERQVQAALNELMQGRTVFAIAHRLSTIIHSDVILVLDQGAIVEQGTHQELLARGGHYKYLYDLQFRESEIRNPVQT
jgi:subfamily B ATP-binding cassette protein MsbA